VDVLLVRPPPASLVLGSLRTVKTKKCGSPLSQRNAEMTFDANSSRWGWIQRGGNPGGNVQE
jgi:hypothetical protein